MKPVLLAAMLAAAAPLSAASIAAPDDPHQWLEDISGEPALDWVRARNARSLPALEAQPGFAEWQARALAILEDPRRIAAPTGIRPTGVTDTHVFNFWRDAQNVRGLLRRTPRAAYDAGNPQWETLLSIDALEAEEGRNWQFSSWIGAQCMPPDFGRCLVGLSVGGQDSAEVREFDIEARRFVPESEGGFRLGDAKQIVAWADADRLLVATAEGPQTTSGYAREARLWQRGTPFGASRLLLTAAETDMGLWPAGYGSGDSRRLVIDQRVTFWTGRIHHVGADGALTPSPLPDDADFRFIADLGDGRGPRAFALLRTDWRGIPAGSLVAYTVPASGAPGPVEALLRPTETQAITGLDSTGRALYVQLLDNVAGRILRIAPGPDGWAIADVPVPANATVTITAADSADAVYLTAQTFTTPSTLLRAEGGAAPAALATAPAHFDGSRVAVEQRFATSADGTRVPYFLVRPRNATGPLPTYLWAYGGFEIAMTPSYLAPDAMMWVEAGNQYVLANIRGGGEFGPAWHQAALREHRQRSYDDLHAVAEHLKREGQASAVGVHGRSNGGLMAAVAYTQRPDLYDAALVGVPLADMRRYHLLLAGASWMDEYGNPDTDDWEFIRAYSPYHNLRADARYPRVFFYTSTKDDRVHPAHARKMAAEMERLGHAFDYYENLEGGHAGVADLRQSAYRFALMLAYLTRELRPTAAASAP